MIDHEEAELEDNMYRSFDYADCVEEDDSLTAPLPNAEDDSELDGLPSDPIDPSEAIDVQPFVNTYFTNDISGYCPEENDGSDWEGETNDY